MRMCLLNLLVGSQRQVGAQTAVTIMAEKDDARVFGVWIEHVEVSGMPPRVDRNSQIEVG